MDGVRRALGAGTLAAAQVRGAPASERRPAKQAEHVQLDSGQRAHGAAGERRQARGGRQSPAHLLVLGRDPQAGQRGCLPCARRPQRLYRAR